MSITALTVTRRRLLAGSAALGATFALGAPLRAQSEGPVALGALLPLSGPLAQFGPQIAAAQKAVIDEVNAAGGVLGRQIAYYPEDDQNVPDTGLLATRKLIGVDHVSAIMGNLNSAVTAAMMPVAWENKVMVLAVAGSDSLVELPHQGYFVRTQPHTVLQGVRLAEVAQSVDAKSVFILSPQQPYSANLILGIRQQLEPTGVKVEELIFDAKKTSFRSEVEAAIADTPDVLILGGYPPENVIIAKEIYRAGYEGHVVVLSAGLTPAVIEGAGAEVVDGWMTSTPVADSGSNAYAHLAKLLGVDAPHLFSAQGYDQASLAILAIAKAGTADGTAIRDNIRLVGNEAGVPVSSAVEGLKALAEGKEINYLGASGPCKFEDNGNIKVTIFRTLKVVDGALVPQG